MDVQRSTRVACSLQPPLLDARRPRGPAVVLSPEASLPVLRTPPVLPRSPWPRPARTRHRPPSPVQPPAVLPPVAPRTAGLPPAVHSRPEPLPLGRPPAAPPRAAPPAVAPRLASTLPDRFAPALHRQYLEATAS